MDSKLSVRAQKNDFGAELTGIALNKPLSAQQVEEIKHLWHRYQVVYFPDQPLTHPQLEAFTLAMGPFGHDPYIQAIENHQHILEIRRDPDEAVAPFGGSWHSDWSFQPAPPSATILHAKVVPPVGGATHYADGIRAFEALDAGFRDDLSSLRAVHSARRPYSHEGYRLGGERRSMKILPNDDAWATQVHPLIRTHPASGRQALWINPVYTLSIEGLEENESQAMLERLFAHLLQPEFTYRHRWSENMLTMWDNRSVLHCAQGGYDGYRRIMHRTTVAGSAPFHRPEVTSLERNI
ncbi:MAG TPA: TauD/TfdA family dioxygenase [Gammaproteobacteria bacterium]|nr:MAG: TauD/TfdA family dioxygenase [Gammaproteobacteria bacterium TMED134]RZO70878.1 MAG: TauD/TfdA family dioxygenase [OM182 bacterium]HAL43032.1 TauD/TfdA family dioxygenase [Gammaproteobacteria bacterium]|tara:strand:+ start:7807 stop:8691 length:885 start_codon:yes stop_codon:yes gene_type:complete